MAEQTRDGGTVVFLHNPRVGGTTFRWIMERNYPAHAIYSDYRGADTRPLGVLRPAHLDRLRCLSSHRPIGAYEAFLRQPVSYITLFRDPVAREVSHYRYRKSLNKHPIHSIARSASVQKYFEAVQAFRLDNYQVRLLSGQGHFGEVNEQSLDRAKENLSERICAFGLTERFPESILLMSRVLGWRRLTYVVRHRGPDRSDRREIAAELKAGSAQVNHFDERLYRYSRDLFAQRLAELGITFEGVASVRPAGLLETAQHLLFRARLRAAYLFTDRPVRKGS